MVGERLLQHQVHRLQVLGGRQPVAVLADPAHPYARPRTRQHARLGLVLRSTGRAMCSQVRTQL